MDDRPSRDAPKEGVTKRKDTEMPEQVFDKEQFLAMNRDRNDTFVEAKKTAGKRWSPPPGDYTVEMVDTSFAHYNNDDGSQVRVANMVMRIVEAEDAELVEKNFIFQLRDTAGDVLGITAGRLGELYDGISNVPDDLGDAFLGLETLHGNYYKVKAILSKDGQWTNYRITEFIGKAA